MEFIGLCYISKAVQLSLRNNFALSQVCAISVEVSQLNSGGFRFSSNSIYLHY